MNFRIFLVRAMKCTCEQAGPRFVLSSGKEKKKFGGMESEQMLTPKGKMPSTGKILLRGGSNPRRCIKQDSEPNRLPTSYFSPGSVPDTQFACCSEQQRPRPACMPCRCDDVGLQRACNVRGWQCPLTPVGDSGVHCVQMDVSSDAV